MEIQEKIGGKCADSFVDRCIAYIGEHANECVKLNSHDSKSNGFLNLSKEAIIKIISSDFVSYKFTYPGHFLNVQVFSFVSKKKMFSVRF